MQTTEHDLNRKLFGDVYSVIKDFISLTLDYKDFKQYISEDHMDAWKYPNGFYIVLPKNIIIFVVCLEKSRNDTFGLEVGVSALVAKDRVEIGLHGYDDVCKFFHDGDQFTITYK